MNYKALLFLILVLKALLMIAIILYSGIGLGPDEAQYYTWSQHLDFGYYSKPPAIAWQIFFGTLLFGKTELGVRFFAIVIGTLFSLAIFHLGKIVLKDERGAFFSSLAASFTPIGVFSTFLAITDGGMLLFWTMGLSLLFAAIVSEKPLSWVLFGLSIAAGALFKWPIYFLIPLAYILSIFYPVLRGKRLFLASLVSLLGLLPTLFWNVQNDFVTFRHVFTIVKGGNDGGGSPNPLEFFLSQALLLSPLFFLLFLVALVKRFNEKDPKNVLGWITGGILTLFTLYAFLKKGQGNWCLFAYPSAFVFLAGSYVYSKKGALVFNVSLVVSFLLSLFPFLIPTLQEKEVGFVQIPWKVNPFRHNVGLTALGEGLAPQNTGRILIGDKYQTTSQLSFYSIPQQQAFFLNLLGLRKNQFSFWPPPERGENALFVVIEMEPGLSEKIKRAKEFYPGALSGYFESVQNPFIIPLFSAYGKVVKAALVYPCEGFSGKLPEDPEKY